jgi:hypothetical protein
VRDWFDTFEYANSNFTAVLYVQSLLSTEKLRLVTNKFNYDYEICGLWLCQAVLLYKNGDYLNFVEYIGQNCYHGNQDQPQELSH